MKIIVTGSAGFVGSNLVDELLKLNHNVIGVDNLSTGFEEHYIEHINNTNFEFLNLDLNKNLENSLFEK